MLLISLPSVVLAFLKLRKRNLGPILDANGWAVNARAKINIPFGATLTDLAKLPPGSRRDAHDPYAEKGFPWMRAVLLVLLMPRLRVVPRPAGWTAARAGARGARLRPPRGPRSRHQEIGRTLADRGRERGVVIILAW